MHGPPPSSARPTPNHRQSAAACPTVPEGREWTESQQEEEQPTYPRRGYHVSANLWNVDIADRFRKPGPMASFLRHVTSMQSPNNPTYVDTRIYPVFDVRELRREATLKTVAAGQRYLKRLQFEMRTLGHGRTAAMIKSWVRLTRFISK